MDIAGHAASVLCEQLRRSPLRRARVKVAEGMYIELVFLVDQAGPKNTSKPLENIESFQK
jgi:hypothetical protein